MKYARLRHFTAKYSLSEQDCLMIHAVQAVISKRSFLLDGGRPKCPDCGVLGRLLDREEGSDVKRVRKIKQARRAAVVLSHLGPGLTNAATGVANAGLDSVPMVVIAGDVPSHYYGKHPHQEVNLHADASQFEIYRPFVKRAWRVDRPDLFPEIIEKAFQLAESGRPGPVLVSVPMDIFSKEIDVSLFERLKLNTKKLHKPSIDDELATKIVTILMRAENPLVYVGGGIILADAMEELREFVSHLNIPVAHSLMGKGALPDDHPMTLGMTGFWGTKFINDKCKGADWILALGTLALLRAPRGSWR